MAQDFEFAFIHIPKTAGSTLRHMLRCVYGSHHCDIKIPVGQRKARSWANADDLELAKKVYPRLSGIVGHRVTSFAGLEEAVPTLRYFTFLREPTARFISHFHYAIQGHPDRCDRETLRAYAENPDNHNIQTRWLSGSQDATKAIEHLESHIDLVGLTERFNESLVLLGNWLAIPEADLYYQSKNVSTRVARFPYLDDPELRCLIEGANTLDIEVYNHAKKHVFPRQIEAAGAKFSKQLKDLEYRNSKVLRQRREPLSAQMKRNFRYKVLLHQS